MRKLFIAGDSYCFYRTDPEQHWPARLADNLNLELHGEGFPGEGWWPTRKKFIEYVASDYFLETDLFVFCHTEPHRIISSNPNLLKGNFESVKETYFKYIQSDDVSTWAVAAWYKELNDILKNKQVIHLQCFKHDEFSILEGIRLQTPLLNISITSAAGNLDLPEWGGKVVLKKMNEYNNHFSPAVNQQFADFITSRFLNHHVGEDLVYSN
jgi:hypothetical protein